LTGCILKFWLILIRWYLLLLFSVAIILFLWRIFLQIRVILRGIVSLNWWHCWNIRTFLVLQLGHFFRNLILVNYNSICSFKNISFSRGDFVWGHIFLLFFILRLSIYIIVLLLLEICIFVFLFLFLWFLLLLFLFLHRRSYNRSIFCYFILK
jgi:hypothetical protein